MGGNAFFAYVPKWRCVDYFDGKNMSGNGTGTTEFRVYNDAGNISAIAENKTVEYWNQKCYTFSGKECTKFEFDDSIHTLVSEVRMLNLSDNRCKVK